MSLLTRARLRGVRLAAMSGYSSRPPLPPVPPGYVDIARRPSPTPGYGAPHQSFPSPPAFVQSPPAHQQGFAPQHIVAPVPSRLPSHIPARQLETQASEIGVGPRDAALPGAWPPSPPQQYDQYFPSMHQPRLQVHPPHQPVVSPPTPNAPAAFPSPQMSPYGGGHGFAPSPSVGQLSSGMAGLAMDQRDRRASSASYSRSPDGSAGSGGRSPSSATAGNGVRRGSDQAPLAIVMPTLDELAAQRAAAGSDPSAQVRWARELLRYVERTTTGSSITDPRLVRWIDEAVRSIIRAAGLMPPVPEALYLRADLAMSGSFPSLVPKVHQRSRRPH